MGIKSVIVSVQQLPNKFFSLVDLYGIYLFIVLLLFICLLPVMVK